MSDIANFTEVIAAALGFTRTETTNVGDSIMRALAQGVSETVGLLESVAVTTGKNFSLGDSAGIVESISTTLGFPQTETTALGDSIRSALAKGVPETVSLLESVAVTTAKNFSLTDSAGIAGSISTTLGFSSTEMTALGDLIRSALAKGVSDRQSPGFDCASVCQGRQGRQGITRGVLGGNTWTVPWRYCHDSRIDSGRVGIPAHRALESPGIGPERVR